MIHWSLDALARAGCAPLIVVVPEAIRGRVASFLDPYDDALIVPGGETRQVSVANGLAEAVTDQVVVHDAARPLIDAEMVEHVRAALRDADGAVVAVPVDETLKKVDRGRVVSTIDRAGLWRSQTPQAFRTAVLRDCHARAVRDGVVVTDDAGLLEHYGHEVVIVEGRRSNIKVTWPDDFALAEGSLARRLGDGAPT